MPDFTPEDAKQAFDELKTKMKKYGEDSTEYKTALENTQKTLDAQEENSQKLTKEIAEERKVRGEQDERIKTLELEVARGGSSGTNANYKETPEYKALTHWIAEGDKGLETDEAECLNTMQKTLRTDIDTGAGYLTMPEMDTSLVKTITEISNLRSVARVRTTSKKVLDIPKRTAVPTATYEGEAAAGDDDESVYGSEQLTSFRLTVTVPFTQDMLMDSSFDLEAEINADVAEGMAQKEGNKFILGTGSKEPEGFLVNATVVAAAVPSTVTDGLAAVDLTYMTGELKTGYNPMYGFNRRTLAYCRSLEDGEGHPIWQMNLADGAPNSINGEPYILLPDMPDLAGGALSVVYADFSRGYTITDRTGLMIVRDPYAKKRQAIIEITFSKWNTGQVILPEAFVLLEIKS
ncbi:MAG: phage major capsid protein [Bacteroidetes bacterium]|nr:phage major capsid protein [Bacteroidota bacterium]